MEVKKFVFCVLFFTHAINSAEEDDSNNKKISISTVEEDNLINKNIWNTKEWGSIYFLFPHLSSCNIIYKMFGKESILGELKNNWGILFNFLLSGVIEYKYMFHKKWGINIRLNLNNIEIFYGKVHYPNGKFVYYPIKEAEDDEKIKIGYDYIFSLFSLDFSLEWIYKRGGKKIYSGSFCPISISKLVTKEEDINYDYLFWGFTLLKFEYNRCFYLNLGKIKSRWSFFGDDKENTDNLIKKNLRIIFDFLSIEFGLNIIGVNDWIKRKENFEI